MARRIKENPTAQRWAVEEHPLTSTVLIEITPSDPWHLFAEGKFKVDARVKGAIVKVTPPADVSDETIAKLHAVLDEAGALAIRTMPRPKSAVVPANVKVTTDKPAHRSVRTVVLQLVEEANTKNRDGLRGIVEETMSKVGL